MLIIAQSAEKLLVLGCLGLHGLGLEIFQHCLAHLLSELARHHIIDDSLFLLQIISGLHTLELRLWSIHWQL